MQFMCTKNNNNVILLDRTALIYHIEEYYYYYFLERNILTILIFDSSYMEKLFVCQIKLRSCDQQCWL